MRGREPFGPRAGDQIALDVAGRVAEIVRLVWADLECARADRLPDEEGCDFTAAQRRRQDLGVEVLHGDGLRIDLVLGQVFRNEPGAGRSDARRDGLAGKILRRLDILAGNDDVAFGVALDHRDGAIVAFDAEEILHARQVAGHDDVALTGLESLEGGRSRREETVCHVETFLLIEALLDRHPDCIIVNRRLAEQGHFQRSILRLCRREAEH